MKLSYNIYFDDEDGKFIAEKFFIDGHQVSEEEYDDMLDEFDEINDEDEVDPCEYCECRGCCEEDVQGFTYEDLLDVFVDKLLDTEGCPGCIRDVLDEFADIFIGDDD